MRLTCLAMVLLFVCCCGTLVGCARHTYLVELNDGRSFYVDPPLVLDSEKGVYRMWVSGKRYTIAMDDVRTIDDAAHICYQNTYTDTFTCYDALYQF